MQLRLPVGLTLALLLVGWPCNACAADLVVGSVVAVRGAVFAHVSAGQQPLVVNSPVHRGESIVTGAGKAKIALTDGTIVSIGENSHVRLADFSGTPAASKITLELVTGVLRPLVKSVSTGSFEVQTETAIAAVRGTDWVIEVAQNRTSVAVLRGVVAVFGRSDRRAGAVLRLPGHGTDVSAGSAPTPPAPWGIKRLADVLARATFD